MRADDEDDSSLLDLAMKSVDDDAVDQLHQASNGNFLQDVQQHNNDLKPPVAARVFTVISPATERERITNIRLRRQNDSSTSKKNFSRGH